MSNSFEDNKRELIFHFNEIYKKCGNSFHIGWGSYLFNGHSYLYDSRMLEKQKLIFDLAKNNKSVLVSTLAANNVPNTTPIITNIP